MNKHRLIAIHLYCDWEVYYTNKTDEQIENALEGEDIRSIGEKVATSDKMLYMPEVHRHFYI